MISVTSDHNLHFHSIDNDLNITRQIAGYNEEVVDLAFLKKCPNLLAIASNSEQIRIQDMNTPFCDILNGHSEAVICIDQSADGTLLASGSKDKSVIIWRFSDTEKKFKMMGQCLGHTDAVGAIAFARKTNTSIISGSQDLTVKMWDISSDKSGEVPKFKSLFTFQAHDKDINSIAIAPNDKVFATGSQDKTAKVWGMAIAAEEKFVATGGADSRITIWEDYSKEEDEIMRLEVEERATKYDDFEKAFLLALDMDFPLRLLHILSDLQKAGSSATTFTGSESMDELIKNLNDKQIGIPIQGTPASRKTFYMSSSVRPPLNG
ncbi:Transducin (beta)-like 3 [Blyttiomyces sp. JEL0837]|nr:Transducin (beta)-like 3 [Blyttiomyces sp. JEL0837]